MSSNYHNRQGALARRRSVEVIKATPKRVEADDHDYAEKRVITSLVRIYVRKNAAQVIDMLRENGDIHVVQEKTA